jgi:hypothetical protein
VPTFLTAEAAGDIWAAAESGLSQALRENPELERALLDPLADELGPADRMFRSFVLEERGIYTEVASLDDLYTPEMERVPRAGVRGPARPARRSGCRPRFGPLPARRADGGARRRDGRQPARTRAPP